jgi:radical SAM enzyme (TIGR01210 family)
MERSTNDSGIEINRQSIQSHRSAKATIDPFRPIAVIHETEPTARQRLIDRPCEPHPPTWPVSTTGKPSFVAPSLASVTSVFLAGAECTFRCTMCDLWKHTLDQPTPRGAIPKQIEFALRDRSTNAKVQGNAPTRLPVDQTPQWIKLYNSSNFFDRRSVPPEDWHEISKRVIRFDRVIVENHPRLIDDNARRFAGQIAGKLEIAMGLETVFEPSIRLLNKQMTLTDFRQAADRLMTMEIDLRVFILLQPPGTPAEQAIDGVFDSLRFARQCGARHASIIPTRGGNGIMEQLALGGQFKPPDATSLERCFELALQDQSSMVVTVDLWDFDKLSGLCETCSAAREQRLSTMNLTQSLLPIEQFDCQCFSRSMQ